MSASYWIQQDFDQSASGANLLSRSAGVSRCGAPGGATANQRV